MKRRLTNGSRDFFAVLFVVNYVPVGTERENSQFPVLLTATHRVGETLPDPADNQKLLAHRRLVKHVRAAWWWFKMGAISCFSFVGPVGCQREGHKGGIPLADRINSPEFALRAMFLTENFAPFVLVVGHGSTVVNNAHWTGLDCGACGGHTGEANARVAAAVFNDPATRKVLDNVELAKAV